tara:strand:- start:250 stop:1305 length:1056 start_codon:yes stop_codon:yes gene_type:complete
MTLQDIVGRYHGDFLARYGHTVKADQRSALHAIMGCRQGAYGDLALSCTDCSHHDRVPRSCGHRACNQCQHGSTQAWLDRQLHKLLPVNYYMATFTLPAELRGLAKSNPAIVYRLLMECAVKTLRTFGLNKKSFNAELGFCAVLHTHTRRLDYHPHVHIVIPGGGIHRARKQWRKVQTDYLFNGFALAKVFKGMFLKALSDHGLKAKATPPSWVVHCKKVGKGKAALEYLSRYLYKGVISNSNIIEDDGVSVTFRFLDSKTKTWMTRTLKGEDFIHQMLQHVLPKGFRRVRDFGFLHGNAKALLRVVQWVLKVQLPSLTEKPKSSKSSIRCKHCQGKMNVIGIIRGAFSSA